MYNIGFLSRDKKKGALSTPILVERQHFIREVPKKQPSVCYPTKHYWLFFCPSLSVSANCNDLLSYNPTSSPPTHLIITSSGNQINE